MRAFPRPERSLIVDIDTQGSGAYQAARRDFLSAVERLRLFDVRTAAKAERDAALAERGGEAKRRARRATASEGFDSRAL